MSHAASPYQEACFIAVHSYMLVSVGLLQSLSSGLVLLLLQQQLEQQLAHLPMLGWRPRARPIKVFRVTAGVASSSLTLLLSKVFNPLDVEFYMYHQSAHDHKPVMKVKSVRCLGLCRDSVSGASTRNSRWDRAIRFSKVTVSAKASAVTATE